MQKAIRQFPSLVAALAAFVFWGALLALPGAPGARAQAKPAWNTESVLKQLEEESKSFRGMTANIERIKVTVVVNDRSVETGTMTLRKDNKMLIELNPPDARTVLRNDDKLYVYNPKLKRVEEYDLGKYKSQIDQYMLLGFGSGDLKKNYLATYLGEQTLDQKKVLLLELTPKDEKVRSNIAKIHLWIDPGTWLASQQKFFEAGGDHFTIHYTNVQRNPRTPDSKFRAAWPKTVQRVKPQG